MKKIKKKKLKLNINIKKNKNKNKKIYKQQRFLIEHKLFQTKIWELLNIKFRKMYKITYFLKLFFKILLYTQSKTIKNKIFFLLKLNYFLNFSKTKLRNFCIISKRNNSIYRFIKFSRIILKKKISENKIPGLQNSSW